VQVTYQRSSFKVVGLGKDDFPKLPDAPKSITKLDAKLLADWRGKDILRHVGRGKPVCSQWSSVEAAS